MHGWMQSFPNIRVCNQNQVNKLLRQRQVQAKKNKKKKEIKNKSMIQVIHRASYQKEIPSPVLLRKEDTSCTWHGLYLHGSLAVQTAFHSLNLLSIKHFFQSFSSQLDIKTGLYVDDKSKSHEKASKTWVLFILTLHQLYCNFSFTSGQVVHVKYSKLCWHLFHTWLLGMKNKNRSGLKASIITPCHQTNSIPHSLSIHSVSLLIRFSYRFKKERKKDWKRSEIRLNDYNKLTFFFLKSWVLDLSSPSLCPSSCPSAISVLLLLWLL